MASRCFSGDMVVKDGGMGPVAAETRVWVGGCSAGQLKSSLATLDNCRGEDNMCGWQGQGRGMLGVRWCGYWGCWGVL